MLAVFNVICSNHEARHKYHEGKGMIYLPHFIYCYVVSDVWKEGSYGYMVSDIW